MLAALAAVLAMIPLTRSAFWGPIAITIMGGLFIATFLALLFFPAFDALWYQRQFDKFSRLPSGAAPVSEGKLALAA